MIEIIIIMIIIALFKGGKVQNLYQIEIKKPRILVVMIILELISIFLLPLVLNPEREYIFKLVHMLSYGLLVILLFINRNLTGSKLFLSGGIANFLVMLVNKGKMPVSGKALLISGDISTYKLLNEGMSWTHKLMGSDTYLDILGDFIPIPKPYFYARIISIGDLLLSIGLGLLLYQVLLNNRKGGIDSET